MTRFDADPLAAIQFNSCRMPLLKPLRIRSILESVDRADLHALVDSMPEVALKNAKRMLEHLQVWPPQRSPEMERMRQIGQEQRGANAPVNPARHCWWWRWRRQLQSGYGHPGHTRCEDDTLLLDLYHSFKGYEIAVTERLRLTDDDKGIRYTIQAHGPKGEPILDVRYRVAKPPRT